MKNLLITILKARRKKRQFRYKKNITASLQILESVINILDRHKIDYYLDFGTLIGAVREKGFIPWDDDVDISITTNDNSVLIKQLLTEELDSNSLKVSTGTLSESETSRSPLLRWLEPQKPNQQVINFTDPNNLRIIKIKNFRYVCSESLRKLTMQLGIVGRFLNEGDSCLDIFIKYQNGDRVYWIAQNIIHSLPKSFIKNELIEVNFYHLKCKIPKNYDAYLSEIYGDWRTKKENWQYYENNTCLEAEDI